MIRNSLGTVMVCLVIPAAMILSGCQGIMPGIYDEPAVQLPETAIGKLYIDASDWEKWHYIDFKALKEETDNDVNFNTSSLWETYSIPIPDEYSETSTPKPEQSGIYTYWYDIFGEGLNNIEYRGFMSAKVQPEPENWTLAVHRNNVRTNGCGVSETDYTSIDEVPTDHLWLENREYHEDEWNQTDVWAVQNKMLLGEIGNQGIYINNVLSQWLIIEIPPMPPLFRLNNHVYILKLKDNTFAAIQLADYISASGYKCCLTINYKYPL